MDYFLTRVWKNQKEKPGDIIILQKCTKNHDHTLYCSWDMVHDGLIVIFHFGLIFAFLPWKIKIKKNQKIPRGIILPKYTQNFDHMLYCFWNMARDRCNFFHFGLFFEKLLFFQNFTKTKKILGHIIILHMCSKNYDQTMYSSWDMVCKGQIDRWKDGRKWHIEVGAPPKNFFYLL